MKVIQTERYTLHHGDNRVVLKEYPDNHFDSIVCDPPYEIGFMGKGWDGTGIAYDVAMWRECLRVLKPGGHLLAFGGSRTYHRMACAIEDAGFEIRDQIMWVYGSGFPKSLNVGKAIDKEAGIFIPMSKGFNAAGEGGRSNGGDKHRSDHPEYQRPTGLTAEAQQWDGWGTALKPAHEPIVVARKPLERGLTVAGNVLKWGTGGINVDGCRVAADDAEGTLRQPTMKEGYRYVSSDLRMKDTIPTGGNPNGRWPANFVLSYPEEEYIIRDDITPKELLRLAEWINENT